MPEESSVYIGYMDGASRHSQNLASMAWVIYSPTSQLVSVGGVCLRETTNNVVEYSVIIEILRDALSHDIRCLHMFLDSQLVVSQLNGLYQIHDSILLHRFLRVHLLE
jgi:ribonuclease HI